MFIRPCWDVSRCERKERGGSNLPSCPPAPELASDATGAPMKCQAMDGGGRSDATRMGQGGGGVWGQGPHHSGLPHPEKSHGHRVNTCNQEGLSVGKPRHWPRLLFVFDLLGDGWFFCLQIETRRFYCF